MFLLLELESHGVNTNIWSFLEIKDVVHLIEASKLTREVCIRINSKVSASIKIFKIK